MHQQAEEQQVGPGPAENEDGAGPAAADKFTPGHTALKRAAQQVGFPRAETRAFATKGASIFTGNKKYAAFPAVDLVADRWLQYIPRASRAMPFGSVPGNGAAGFVCRVGVRPVLGTPPLRDGL